MKYRSFRRNFGQPKIHRHDEMIQILELIMYLRNIRALSSKNSDLWSKPDLGQRYPTSFPVFEGGLEVVSPISGEVQQTEQTERNTTKKLMSLDE